MAENKTKPTEVSVEAFLEAAEPPQRRDDGKALCALMARLSGEPATMWGPTMVGFGRYRYRYESGREGDIFRVGFAPRKPATVLYIDHSFEGAEALIGKMGKISRGKGCIYVKALADLDPAVLEELITRSLAHNRRSHPDEVTSLRKVD